MLIKTLKFHILNKSSKLNAEVIIVTFRIIIGIMHNCCYAV